MYIPERRDPLRPTLVDVEASRVRSVPTGSVERAIRDTWRRYGRPMALTEISLAGDPHDQVAWWNEAWSAAVLTRRAGMDVRAVTAWSAFGATDWHCLMRRPENIYEPGAFDASFDPPLRRPVAGAISASAGRPRRRSTRSAQAATAS
jgi:dTDP-4-dehydrorhamnose reductase